jgi:ribosomal protein S27AE
LELPKGIIIMPQKVFCQKCGHVLYEGPDLKPPDEIIQKHNGKCPKCGKKLSFIPIDVEVKPAVEK